MNPLEQRVAELEGRLAQLEKRDRYTIQKLIQILDGRNIQLGTTTGTKIGTATTQKLGFYNATPIVRPATINDPSTPSAAYSQAEAQSAVTAINTLIDRLQALGLIA